ncbi:MAG: hypothetical protein ACK4YS_08145 [Aphanizomenon sp.]
MIDNIQERIEVLERCLNDANPQDEKMAEMIEFATSRQISLSRLENEWRQFGQKSNKLNKLAEKLNEKIKAKQEELPVLTFVRYNFLLKEILDAYWEFFHNKNGEEALKKIFGDFVKLWKNQDWTNFEFHRNQKSEFYVMVETLKHVIQSLIKASLGVNALSEEEISAFNLGDIMPQESETTLTFLASIKKWDYVYRKLA